VIRADFFIISSHLGGVSSWARDAPSSR